MVPIVAQAGAARSPGLGIPQRSSRENRGQWGQSRARTTECQGPGEFIRDHLLEPEVGGRDYIGSMFQAFKEHLRDNGYSNFPCRLSFGRYIWLLKETGAIAFDEAEPVAFGLSPLEALPAAYEPSCGMPAPRHYYRMVDPNHQAFLAPTAVWRELRGLGPVVVVRRPPARVAPIGPPPPPAVAVAPPALPRRPRTRVGRFQHEADLFRVTIEGMRGTLDESAVASLETDMLDFFDRVIDAAASARGRFRDVLLAMAEDQERAGPGFEMAREAIEDGDIDAFNRALELLLECCPLP